MKYKIFHLIISEQHSSLVKPMINKKNINAFALVGSFLILTCGGALADNLIKTGQWSYFSDTVMGGVSEGSASFKNSGSEKFLRLTGEVSTENNGGFVQVRSAVPQGIAKAKTGIKIKVKGNGEQYYLHIRNSSTQLPWHYYQQGFDAKDTWQEIILPFDLFEKSSSLMWSKMKESTIKTIGIVAYGKDHTADVSIMSLEFY